MAAMDSHPPLTPHLQTPDAVGRIGISKEERLHEDKTPGSMGRSLHAGSGAIGAGGRRGGRCDPVRADGASRAIPDASRFRDRTRAQCRAGRDLRQGHGPHSRFAGLPDRRPRHQRIHLSGGEVVDVAVREPRFLESEDQGTGLLQPGSVRVRSSRTRSGGRSSHSPETRRKGFSTRFAPRSRATSSPHPSRARCPS